VPQGRWATEMVVGGSSVGGVCHAGRIFETDQNRSTGAIEPQPWPCAFGEERYQGRLVDVGVVSTRYRVNRRSTVSRAVQGTANKLMGESNSQQRHRSFGGRFCGLGQKK